MLAGDYILYICTTPCIYLYRYTILCLYNILFVLVSKIHKKKTIWRLSKIYKFLYMKFNRFKCILCFYRCRSRHIMNIVQIHRHIVIIDLHFSHQIRYRYIIYIEWKLLVIRIIISRLIYTCSNYIIFVPNYTVYFLLKYISL